MSEPNEIHQCLSRILQGGGSTWGPHMVASVHPGTGWTGILGPPQKNLGGLAICISPTPGDAEVKSRLRTRLCSKVTELTGTGAALGLVTSPF